MQKAQLIKSLATTHRTIILMTGATDYLSDGTTVLAIHNGHPYLGNITGSGCALGSVIASFLASARDLADQHRDTSSLSSSYLTATLAAILLYSIAAEIAVQQQPGSRLAVHGPGSFIPAFIDALYHLTHNDGAGKWLERANVEVLDV